jgi:hypothetical protein
MSSDVDEGGVKVVVVVVVVVVVFVFVFACAERNATADVADAYSVAAAHSCVYLRRHSFALGCRGARIAS